MVKTPQPTNQRAHQLAARGFSLIEVMVAMAIVAILASVALPNYSAYVMRNNRNDAMRALVLLANTQEQYYIANLSYAGNITDLTVTSLSGSGHYLLSVVNGSAAGFVLQANPEGAGVTSRQKDDGSFRISSIGVKEWDCGETGYYSCNWEDATRK